MDDTTVQRPILAYRGRLLPGGRDQRPVLEHTALDVVTEQTDRDELRSLIAQGNVFFYRRAYRLALSEYEKAYRKVLALGLPSSDPMHMSVRLLLGDALSALFRFPEAMTHFVAVSEEDVTAVNSPITLSELWKKLAKVFLGAGDSFYKSAADDVAARQDEIKDQYNLILGDGLAPNPASPLYQNALVQMLNPVRRIVQAIDDDTISTKDIDAEIVAIVLDCRVRFDQVAQGLNYLGHGSNYVPVVRFKHLQNVARSFASTAAQANREYLSYVTKIQDETFNLRQLEQAVEVNRSGVATHRAAEAAADEEANAAREAVRLANTRRNQAQAYANRFATEGYEIALLEEALAWAQSPLVCGS